MSLTYTLTDQDGTSLSDISTITSQKAATRLLNLPGTAKGRVPAHLVGTTQTDGFPLLTKGRRLKVHSDGTIFHNGMIVNLQDDGDANTAYTTFTSIDPMWIWGSRPARDADGDFSKPTFLTDFVDGPSIMAEILANSETYEGSTFLDLASGSVATGGADLSGAPADWPMMIADVFQLLAGTGELDVILTPLDTTDGNMATFNAYNGDYGTDLTGTVNFDYFTGDFNIRSIRRMEDLSTLCNKLWYYLGPKRGIQRWQGNITADDPGLPDPPETALEALRATSQARYGVFMDIKIFDDRGFENAARPIYWRLWQTESLLRMNGRELVNVIPIRGVAPTFDIGDLITLNAGTQLRGGFTDYSQRVYGYTIGEDDDGVVEVSNIVTSADQEL